MTDTLIKGNFAYKDIGRMPCDKRAKIRGMCLQAKERQGRNNHQKLRESMEQILPLSASPQKNQP